MKRERPSFKVRSARPRQRRLFPTFDSFEPRLLLATFTVTSAVGFIVGFMMFGAIIYIPVYLQTVHGASATKSGLELLPLVGGMLTTFITSGRLVSRYGRYKAFPVAGTAVTAVGLYLLSRMTPTTTTLVIDLPGRRSSSTLGWCRRLRSRLRSLHLSHFVVHAHRGTKPGRGAGRKRARRFPLPKSLLSRRPPGTKCWRPGA